MRRNAKQIALGLALTASCISGCSSLNTKAETGKKSIWSPKTWFEEEYQTPASLAVIWSPDTLSVSGQPTMRGFGGRVFFYNEKSQSIPVDGDLVVHGFEKDARGAKDNPAADKSVPFSREELKSHFSPSELGASYSIWVPWDEEGGPRKELSLIATFKTADGKVVQGAPAKLFLPGKTPEGTEELPTPKSPMQQVSYKRSSQPAMYAPPARNTTGVRTTTIAVPRESSLTRKRSTSFTLGGNTGNAPQAVSTGAVNEAIPSSVTVGGKAAPESTTETSSANTQTGSTMSTIRGLPAPPTTSSRTPRTTSSIPRVQAVRASGQGLGAATSLDR